MTTYLIYADANDGWIQSTSTSHPTAIAGSNLVVDSAATTVRVGQNKSNAGIYAAYQGFFSFDTSVIADAEEIVDATLNAHMGYSTAQKVWWDVEFREHNWTAPVSSGQWKSQATLRTYPIRASFDIMQPSSTYRTIATGGDSLLTSINKTAAMKFIAVSSRHVAGNLPIGTEELWIWGGNSTGKPYLKVDTVLPDRLNSVANASTTLADGTTISIRNLNIAADTYDVGYTSLTSSVYTPIAQLDASLDTSINGAASMSITSDAAGNFYIFGQRRNTIGTLYGQAFVRTGPTTWVAKQALSQAMPTGNGQSIRAIASQYMPGGSDATDKPSVHIVLSRGSSGVNLAYRYHTSGAGLVQNAQIKVDSLLAGAGTLINAAAGFNPSACGIPAFVDMVPVGDHLNAIYVQRAKIHNVEVGGIAMVQTYNQSGKFTAWDKSYVATGASQLVPVSDKVFAHVFDSEGTKLVVRLYNPQAQVIGEASIPKENFFGGSIGDKFAAYYDKTAGLVRVFYVAAASSRTLDRFDVSVTTYTGTVASAAVTNFGPASSTNTNLRISRTSDERRVLIEAASVATGIYTVGTAYSTVGNVAPSAPVLTVRPNFDATSAANFTWEFGDTNPADFQTAYQLEISRVADSVVVHDTGKVVSGNKTHTVAANVLVNPTNYRWRVRTYDVMDAAGTWSGYSTFSTSATGTLTISSPATDNLVGIETDDFLVTWDYIQSGGATQAQRRVRVIRTADAAVISDTTMQANTVASHTISGMESGKEYRVEVSLINSSAIAVPVVSRLISPYYSEPMTPETEITLGDSYVDIIIINPAPTGDRPEVLWNDIYRRRTKANSVDSDFVRIGTVANSARYRDYAVKSGTSYDYKVIGRTV